LTDLTQFAIATGMRLGEVCKLQSESQTMNNRDGKHPRRGSGLIK
jgi:hypothetical protein